MRRRIHDEGGQASVELVALLPVLVVAALAAWQLVVAGHAMWMVAGAARAAARARALGHDELAAARAALPGRLRAGVTVRPTASGGVTVRVGIPAVVGTGRLATIGDSHAAIVAARDAARAAERTGQFGVAVWAWHQAARLGDPRAAETLSKLAQSVDCAFTRAAIEEARAGAPG